jgi:hypothetical protein
MDEICTCGKVVSNIHAANARICSSAPDLLEACKEAFNRLAMDHACDSWLKDMLHAAIAKAEGN